MAKDSQTGRLATAGNLMTAPIGKAKAERFTAVEGMSKSAAPKALSNELTGPGLKGDAYRTEVAKAFRKVRRG